MPKTKARISFDALSGDPFALSESQRQSIESAYGHRIPISGWNRIIATTTFFTMATPVKRSAPTKTISQKIITLNAAASSLRDELSHQTTERTPDDSQSLEDIYEKYFRLKKEKYPKSRDDLFEVLLHAVIALMTVSNYVLPRLTIKKENEEFQMIDDLWPFWVFQIGLILKSLSLPVGVRKEFLISKVDLPPLKWSSLKYGFDHGG